MLALYLKTRFERKYCAINVTRLKGGYSYEIPHVLFLMEWVNFFNIAGDTKVGYQGEDCRSGHYFTYTFRYNGVVRRNDEAIADIAVNDFILFYELSSEGSVTTWFTEKDEEISKLEEENVPLSEGQTADNRVNGTTEKPQVKTPDNAEVLEKTIEQEGESRHVPISLETHSSLNVCQVYDICFD
ncbi:hypothetical protein BSL78_04010 [Apostichopus japonicus]|uniref:Uncharacterized protein n=1 Tax=Stichopus japonicus TaxID=307972 RepID=A0A2G8LFM7_STIJA|nr:hypothetical protein BSL78_04010 [Apostichopus japonicus]